VDKITRQTVKETVGCYEPTTKRCERVGEECHGLQNRASRRCFSWGEKVDKETHQTVKETVGRYAA